jgi:hypothetical protein
MVLVVPVVMAPGAPQYMVLVKHYHSMVVQMALGRE